MSKSYWMNRKKRHKHSHCLLLKITEGVGLPGLDILTWQYVLACLLPSLFNCSCSVFLQLCIWDEAQNIDHLHIWIQEKKNNQTVLHEASSLWIESFCGKSIFIVYCSNVESQFNRKFASVNQFTDWKLHTLPVTYITVYLTPFLISLDKCKVTS